MGNLEGTIILTETTQQRTPILLSDAEWTATRASSKAEYQKDILGARPTRESVTLSRHDAPQINFVMWFAIATLIVLTVVTSFKAAFVGIPFAVHFAEIVLADQTIDGRIISAFQFSLVILNIMMATPALIYFKLLSEDASVVKKIKDTKKDGAWNSFLALFDLTYLTPRLPSAMVYVVVLWLLYTAAHGTQDLGDAFLRFIPVFMELALARVVGDILQQNIRFYDIITEVLKDAADKWDAALAAYDDDARYTEILYRHLRHSIIHLVREDERRRKTYPNKWMSELVGDAVEKWVLKEYTRLTGGQSFAVGAAQIRKNRAAGQPETVVAQATEGKPDAHSSAGKRVPPHGDKKWTAETLTRDFELQGLSKEAGHDRGWLDRTYADGYGARGAWAAGAMAFFAKKEA